jgi:sialate O-acetylesterase
MGKKRFAFCQILTVFLAVLLFWGNASAQTQPLLRLPALLGNNMVLQSGVPAPIWGWAAPGQNITVKIAQQTKSTTTDANGKWALKLDVLPAGGPYEMTVEGGTSITVKNILVG